MTSEEGKCRVPPRKKLRADDELQMQLNFETELNMLESPGQLDLPVMPVQFHDLDMSTFYTNMDEEENVSDHQSLDDCMSAKETSDSHDWKLQYLDDGSTSSCSSTGSAVNTLDQNSGSDGSATDYLGVSESSDGSDVDGNQSNESEMSENTAGNVIKSDGSATDYAGVNESSEGSDVDGNQSDGNKSDGSATDYLGVNESSDGSDVDGNQSNESKHGSDDAADNVIKKQLNSSATDYLGEYESDECNGDSCDKNGISLDGAVALIKKTCCSSGCMRHFSPNEVQACRAEHTDKDWILSKFRLFRNHQHETFVVGGKRVCSSAWQILYGINKRSFKETGDLHKKGIVTVVHGNKNNMRYAGKQLATKAWLDQFIKLFGETMPHLNKTMLPSSLTKHMIYRKMQAQFHSHNKKHEIVGIRRFYQIWRNDPVLRDVKIRKEGMFTKCTMCTVTGEERDKTLNKEKRKSFELVLDAHLKVVAKERATYERHKEKARRDNKYLCICIDGMDQSKTSLPHMTKYDKDTAHLWRLHTHVTGALVHNTGSYGKDAMAFISTSDMPSDSNLTINVIMHTLGAYVRKHNKLPEVLYLQFDNCWRENKNMFVLGFAYMLVAMGIVKKVKINFMLVGHTHNDVDQIFSRIAEKLRMLVAYTLEDLKKLIRESYEKPSPDVVILDHMYNFREWIKKHLAGQFRNHSRPHNFRIKKVNGEVLLHYRMYTGDKWEPEAGLKCLKTMPDLTEVPSWVVPNMEKLDVSMLKSDIPKFRIRMDGDAILWWNNYLSIIKTLKQIPPVPTHWPMMTIAAAAESQTERDGDECCLSENVKQIWDKLNRPMQPVTIGSQGRLCNTRRQPTGIVCAAENTAVGVSGENSPSTSAAVDFRDGNDDDNSDHRYEADNNDPLAEFRAVREGMMVGVFVEHYWPDMVPQIGIVTEINFEEETLMIHWYRSSWSGKCVPDYKGGGRSRIPNEELIDIRCVLLWGFNLTHKKNALKGETIAKLKKAYGDIEQQQKNL